MNLNNPIGYKSNQPLQKPFIMNPFRFSSSIPVGGWKELDRTTLGSAGDTIDVTGLPDKRYYTILCDGINTGGSTNMLSQLNADTGTNYAVRESDNGGSDGTGINRTTMNFTGSAADNQFAVGYLSNLSTKEKFLIGWGMGASTSGAGSAPRRRELNAKHAQTTNPITSFKMFNDESGSYNTGSECVVLGWSPSDEHGIEDNFWQELASTNATGTNSFDSGVFTSKKYLMVQIYIDRSGDATNGSITVGNTTLDTGNNYSRRRSADGGGDDTLVNQPNISLRTAGTREFYNIFIINNSANEKLFFINQVAGGSLGAGTPPFRGEFVAKWSNTSNQIDIIGFGSGGSNTLSSTSMIKVWGSD